MQNDYKIINLEYLSAITDSDDFMREILDTFISQVSEIQKNILSALAVSDYKMLGGLVHKAKSSVSIIGMEKDAAELSDLEEDIYNSSKIETYSGRVNAFRLRLDAALAETKHALAQFA